MAVDIAGDLHDDDDSFSDTIERCYINVSGMTCGSCVANVEKSVLRMKGDCHSVTGLVSRGWCHGGGITGWFHGGGVTGVVSRGWCHGGGVTGVVSRELCHGGGVMGVVSRGWCHGGGVTGVVLRKRHR